MRDLKELSSRDLRQLRQRFSGPLFSDFRTRIDLELIRRTELINSRIAWITLGLIAIGVWVLVGSAFGLMEVPH